jgi:hypothetical protein
VDHLALYSRNCKKCKALDPDEVKTFTKCHFDQGNRECPAKEVQFAVVGEAKRLADAVKKARAKSDMVREIEILNLVAKRSAAFQQRFRESSK